MPRCKLTIDEAGERRIVVLNEWVIGIGSAAPSDLVIGSPRVSNPHCRLLRTERGFVLEDLGGDTGSFVNGERVTSRALSPGDRLGVGDAAILYEIEDEASGAADLDDLDPTMTFRLDFKGQESASRYLFHGKDAAARMSFLYEFTRACGALETEELLLEEAARRLLGIGAVRRARVIYRDPVSRTSRCRASAGELPGDPPPEEDLRVVERARALDAGEAILCRIDAKGGRGGGARVDAAGSGDFIAAPLRRDDAVFGWITLAADPGSPAFSRHDLECVAVFGGLLESEVARQRGRRIALCENAALRESLGEERALVGDSEPMRALAGRIARAADSEATILIVGESGTGKELAARALHAGSRRRGEAFVSVNCAVLQHDLAASDLFGHVKGAFTGAVADRAGKFELADGGTLFFDEIGELPYALQAKLLRALQEGEIERVGEGRPRKIDVRVIAATNRDLEAEIATGAFRRDLFFRLAVVEIRMPPLRDRTGDVALLFDHFLDRLSRRAGRPRPSVPAEIVEALAAHDWPGNVRELRNLVERCVVMRRDGDAVSLDDLPAALARRSGAASGGAARTRLDELERAHIAAVLASCAGNKTQAAKLLGIDRSTLYEKMEKYRLGVVSSTKGGG